MLEQIQKEHLIYLAEKRAQNLKLAQKRRRLQGLILEAQKKGYTLSEIGDTMGISKQAVSKYLK